MPKKTKTKHRFDEDTEKALTKLVYNEYETAKDARKGDINEFESIIQMLECVRAEKDYEWLSDYFYPELPSKILTDASNWANQYFQSRDFVEPKLEGNHPGDLEKCKAAKMCINQTLNNRNIYHYQKYIRARLINALGGEVYILAWWEQKTKTVQVGTQDREEILDVDIYGNPIKSDDQIPDTNTISEPIYDEEVVYDNFNYDVFDKRNVFTNNMYTYSIQQKPWIIFRMESTYEELKAHEVENDYFNLDLVKELTKTGGKTETAQSTYLKNESDADVAKPMIQHFDRLIRLGKVWSIIEDKDQDENPIKITPGYDKDNNISDKGELVDVIMEEVFSGSNRVLIRFQPNPFRDIRGRTYYPAARGLCYIHPTKDTGLSDGKYLRELQIAENDLFNMGVDRVKLATLQTFKGRKYALEDNETVYMEPGHVIELENPREDLIEVEIRDDITGMINVEQMLMSGGDKVSSIFPTTMGELPTKASTTATAVAGAEGKANSRSNYKSLTFEYTFLLDLYSLILNMTWQFAHPKTAWRMMGEYSQSFDPDAEYTYIPVTSNIETEYNKYRKIQNYDQTIGRLSGMVQIVPEIVPIIAHMIQRQLELQGDEYQDIAGMIKNLIKAKVNPQGKQGQAVPNQRPGPTSNQNMLPMSLEEQGTREMLSPTG